MLDELLRRVKLILTTVLTKFKAALKNGDIQVGDSLKLDGKQFSEIKVVIRDSIASEFVELKKELPLDLFQEFDPKKVEMIELIENINAMNKSMKKISVFLDAFSEKTSATQE